MSSVKAEARMNINFLVNLVCKNEEITDILQNVYEDNAKERSAADNPQKDYLVIMFKTELRTVGHPHRLARRN